MKIIGQLKNITVHLVRLDAKSSIHSLCQQFKKLPGILNTTTGKLIQFPCRLGKIRRNEGRSLLIQSLLILSGIVLIVSCAPAASNQIFAGGTGFSTDPYQIDSALRLELLSRLVNTDNANYGDKHYKVTTDIDMGLPDLPFSEAGSGTTGGDFVPIGTELDNSAGTFDCDGNTISNLYIKRSTEDSIGLVGYAENATIRNCVLTDVNITGQGFVGGLVGENFQSTISNSYATGAVTGSETVGGLVGWASDSTITHSYAIGAVIGTTTTNIGLFIGLNRSTSSTPVSTGVTASYYNSESTLTVGSSAVTVKGVGSDTSSVTTDNVTGRTTSQMQVAAPQSGANAVYDGWANTTWNFTLGQYPRLINVACADRQYNQAATRLYRSVTV